MLRHWNKFIHFYQLHPRHLRAIIFFFLLFSLPVFASNDFPERPNRLVNDYAGTLSSYEQEQLESKLVDFDRATSTQIAVVIRKSIGGYDANGYAVQLANKWKIGQQGKNNGVLVLLAMETHDVSIQIGYGLEGVSPDIITKHIIEDEMIPSFKQGNFYEGLDKGTNILMALARGEFKPQEYVDREEKFPWFVLVIILFVIIISFSAQVYRVRRYARINHIAFWTAWFLLAQMRRKQQQGTWRSFSSGSGRFGGWGGGGFGGGGFGGFGGGGFGGGGASGKW